MIHARYLGRKAQLEAIDLTLAAAIELDQILRGERHDAPKLDTLTRTLLQDPEDLNESRSVGLRSCPQAVNLFSRALSDQPHPDVQSTSEMDEKFFNLEEILKKTSDGDIEKLTKEEIEEIKIFCLNLNSALLIRKSLTRTPVVNKKPH